MKRSDIARLTGLVYCDSQCGCGENNHLWWTTPNTPAKWHVANGWTTEDVEELIRAVKDEEAKP